MKNLIYIFIEKCGLPFNPDELFQMDRPASIDFECRQRKKERGREREIAIGGAREECVYSLQFSGSVGFLIRMGNS